MPNHDVANLFFICLPQCKIGYFNGYMDNLNKMDDLPIPRIWCPGNPDCDDPKMLCQDLVDDYQAFQVIIYVCCILKTFCCRCSQRSSRADTCKLFYPCSLIKIEKWLLLSNLIIHLYRVYRYEDFSMDPANNTLEVEEQQNKIYSEINKI